MPTERVRLDFGAEHLVVGVLRFLAELRPGLLPLETAEQDARVLIQIAEVDWHALRVTRVRPLVVETSHAA